MYSEEQIKNRIKSLFRLYENSNTDKFLWDIAIFYEVLTSKVLVFETKSCTNCSKLHAVLTEDSLIDLKGVIKI